MTTDDTPIDRASVEALLEGTTPGPWAEGAGWVFFDGQYPSASDGLIGIARQTA